MKQKILLIVISSLAISKNILAQGCSDAGFCSLKYHAANKEEKNTITLGNTIGIGDGGVFINTTHIAYTRQLSTKLYWDVKGTSNFATGDLGNNFNVGDVFTNLSYKAWESSSKQQAFTVLSGVKFPLTVANDKAGNKPLPMAYQSSLGTTDLLLGVNYRLNKWEFTQAWQLPLTKQNKNTFLKEFSTSTDFPSTNNFQRKADALVRVAYNIEKEQSKFSFKPNLLLIYHLANDSYENIFSMKEAIKNSQGVTLNANFIGKYSINKKSSLELSLAAPLVVREVRPDGLTRKFTAGIEYKFSF
jgi:hypothetical protein